MKVLLQGLEVSFHRRTVTEGDCLKVKRVLPIIEVNPNENHCMTLDKGLLTLVQC